MGKGNYYLPHLGFVPYHNVSYNPPLGIVVVFAPTALTLELWYFT